MGLRINDLELGSGSVVESVDDNHDGVSLTLVVTKEQRRQLQELAEHAGRFKVHQPPLARPIVVDASPNGEGLIGLEFTGTNAQALADDGWYLVDSVSDSVSANPQRVTVSLDLKRMGGASEMQGVLAVIGEHVTHDW